MNNIKLDPKIFTMEFGKINVPAEEHFKKVKEEFGELEYAFIDYVNGIKENAWAAEMEVYIQNLCSEALDNVQASISFVSFLINTGVMTNLAMEKWEEKMKDRKKKYLKEVK
jgi:ribonucleotide reductase alpha subunit